MERAGFEIIHSFQILTLLSTLMLNFTMQQNVSDKEWASLLGSFTNERTNGEQVKWSRSTAWQLENLSNDIQFMLLVQHFSCWIPWPFRKRNATEIVKPINGGNFTSFLFPLQGFRWAVKGPRVSIQRRAHRDSFPEVGGSQGLNSASGSTLGLGQGYRAHPCRSDIPLTSFSGEKLRPRAL